jgi:hypothetical protein
VNILQKTSKVGLVVAVIAGLNACTWVNVTAEGENVKVLTAAQAQNCERVGSTTSQALSKVGFVKRKESKLEKELQSLARNEGANLGGNAVVAEGEIDLKEGRQRFGVYRCP